MVEYQITAGESEWIKAFLHLEIYMKKTLWKHLIS